MPNIEFEAGNEFASPKDAVQAAIQSPAALEPTPETTTEGPKTDAWQDQQAEGESTEPETTPTTTPSAPAAPAFIEVKGKGGSKRFNLDPNDPDLKSALDLAQGARVWQRERDEARAWRAQKEPELNAALEKAKVWDELDALSRRGHREQVARAVLGDEGFAELVKQVVREHGEYESADPATRAQIDKERSDRAAALKEDQFARRAAELQAKLDAHEDQVERTRLRSLGTAELKTHDFRGFVKDPDLANSLNQKLWRLAWADLEDLADAGTEVSPEVVANAFAQNAKVLRAGMVKQTEERVAQVLDAKRTNATKAAQIAATERYPSASQEAASGWDGRSSKDLLKRLVGGKRG